MSNVNRGISNPAYVTYPTIAMPRRIKIDGLYDSDIEMVLAMVQFRTGQVGLVLDTTDQSFEQFCKLHQLLVEVMKEMDRRLLLHARTVPGER
jgi:hypothetical protein